MLYSSPQVDTDELMAKPALIASFLDPRHKHLPFLGQREREAAKEKLVAICAAVDGATSDSATGEEDVTASASGGDIEAEMSAAQAGVAGRAQGSAMSMLLGDNYSAPQQQSDPQAEVDNFLRRPSPSLESNPLDWWKRNQTCFPRLAPLARQYLCIPGTSVPSERIFSAAGLTVNRLRSRLTPEHVDMLIFLNKNR